MHLDDVYWEPEGEISLVVVVLVAAFLIGVHDLFPFVRALAQLGGRDTQQARPEPDPQGD
ncbi:MAG: hypothetical protein KY456_10690 [Chloroflexi bacterium]|nr:hypothetical protein [Chloroflexota bacterium]